MAIDLQNAAAQAILKARPDDAPYFKLVVRNKQILCVPAKQELLGDWPVIALSRYDLQKGLDGNQWNTVRGRLHMAKEDNLL